MEIRIEFQEDSSPEILIWQENFLCRRNRKFLRSLKRFQQKIIGD